MKRFILLFFFFHKIYSTEIDFNDHLHNAIIKTKKINFPTKFSVFNAAIIRWGNKYIVTYDLRYKNGPVNNKVGITLLNKNFNVISDTQILDIEEYYRLYNKKPRGQWKLTTQDPRLVSIDNKLFIVYAHYALKRMIVAELHYVKGKFVVKNPNIIHSYPNKVPFRREKNWVPFAYNNQLHLSYSINPHKVFQWNSSGDKNACSLVANTEQNISWQWGELRGGTPALPLNNDEYLAFFHSTKVMKSRQSNNKKAHHYFFGAYTFSRKPPFELKRISPFPIIAKDFYTAASKYKLHKPLVVVFPCGFVMDKDFIHIAYGRQDHEVWIATLDKQKLLDSLVEINKDKD